MATYAIGDVQGCLDSLEALLHQIGHQPTTDVLWFTGDLVNRGPDNLGVLRRVKALGRRAVTVLGNHDLHLLALHYCPRTRLRRGDTLQDVLAAPDREDLLEWLRHRPLFHHNETLNFSLVHAGLPAEWDIAEALARAREVQAALQGRSPQRFLEAMYGNEPVHWQPSLAGPERLRYITNALTRIRYCHRDGRLELKTKDGLVTSETGLLPWFRLPGRASEGRDILFGHWSTLRLSPAQETRFAVHPLDTGAVWGGCLSALRLEDGQRYQVPGLSPPAPLA